MTADVDVILDTAACVHTAVYGLLYDNRLSVRTGRLEITLLAVLAQRDIWEIKAGKWS